MHEFRYAGADRERRPQFISSGGKPSYRTTGVIPLGNFKTLYDSYMIVICALLKAL